MTDLAGLPEPQKRLQRAQRRAPRQIQPEELHEVQLFEAQAAGGPLDDGLHIGGAEIVKPRKIGRELGVHVDTCRRLCAAGGPLAFGEIPDQSLHAGLDVGAIECGHVGIGTGGHVGNGAIVIDLVIAARKLPAAPDDTADGAARPQIDRLDSVRCSDSSRLQ